MKIKYNIIISLVFTFSVIFSGCDHINNETLSLNMVQDLAQSGQDLTWNDFDDYPYEDIGSGLYIRNYKIDEDYHVSVGGASIEKKPLYIYLVKANGEKIDIRHDDMEQFMLK